MSKSKEEEIDSSTKDEYLRKIHSITRHIKNVQDNGLLLAERLIEEGEFELGRRLVQRCFRHDNSKFGGVEWEYLDDPKHPFFNEAVFQHHSSNSHHIEYFLNEKEMQDVDIAEMACDLCARGGEMGAGVREFIKGPFCKKHKFSLQSLFYKRLKYFTDLILSDKFS